ncbi:hypothetical protein PPL_07979 [Heterostelium album PN500]|uniref:Uncharacterized protein n=1 Tax=Heterostelium pallidum (strain ATCC 26659 / Pp 5 / PN500) TaxID=670386 RepID=D3BHH7_HETP5|nr:hypothetical protein PPL_07979 [Heterostelium album PN500]EFA79154.1 hypothetical protein PPL_07979 [Heterostelium album PN500]|eukprot:XP_020431276.1 hypothetical protein PPL_07979 [Heterostelium album PN500]
MNIYQNLTIFLLFLTLVKSNNIVILYNNQYGSGVRSDSTAPVTVVTNCANDTNVSCLMANIVNENDYMGFRYDGNGYDSESLYFLEFVINVNNYSISNPPVVKVFVDTVPTPKAIYLNSTVYLSNLNIFGNYVQGRIKLSELNVSPDNGASFNGVKFGCNLRGSTFLLSSVQLVRDATGTDPRGWIPPKKKSNNAGKIAAGILVPLFVIAICVIAFIIYKKNKANK